MKTFYEFTQEVRNRMSPVTGNQTARNMQQQGSDDPVEFENLRNDIQKIGTKLQASLSRGTLSNEKAGFLVQSLVQMVQNASNLSNTATMNYVKQGIQTNAEPVGSPPMQPQAIG